MVSLLRLLTLLCALLTATHGLATTLTATLDASEVAAGDTVNLTVTVDEQSFRQAPDFNPLKKDFEILSNKQGSQFSMSNGKISSSTSWTLTLLPKKEGYIAIPALTYGKQSTKPLKLHVTKRRTISGANTNEVIFMDALVDKKDAYVQEQVIYTVRLYHSVDLYETSYSPPSADNAVIEMLGNQREYTTSVEGRSYRVIELRYAVFPQQSGTLEIKPAQFSSTLFQGGNRNFLFDSFNGRQVRRSTPRISLNIKPQPSSWPADKAWLPARSLTLQESWTPDDASIQVGEPVTRQITIEAEGLTQTLLPPAPSPEQADLKIYPDQPALSGRIGPRGMVSTRKDSFAIIANKAGNLTLPAVEIPWWDTNNDQIKIARLPARTLTVTGAARQTQTDAQFQQPATRSQEDTAPVSLTSSEPQGNGWQWIALLILFLWLATLATLGYLLWQRRQVQTPNEPSTVSAFSRTAEKAARNDFQSACKNNDPKAARQQLIALYRQVFKTGNIHNLDDVAQRTPAPVLLQLLRDLDAALYKAGNGSWNGSPLLEQVNAALAQKSKDDKQPEPQLKPLFPV